MRKSKRQSTVRNSEKLQSKLADREVKSRQKKSPKSLHREEAVTLPSVSREVGALAENRLEEEISGEEEEYWIDISACSLELSSPTNPFPQPPADSERWSTSVNRFGIDLAATEGSEDLPTSGSFPLLSPEPELNKQVSSVCDQELVSLISPNLSTETLKDSNMEEADYQAKYMEMDNDTVNIESLLARFNKDTVSLLDIGTFRDDLNGIFDAFTKFEKKYLDIRSKMDRNKEADILRLTTLKELHERIKKKVIENEVQVKKALQDLQMASGSAAPSAGLVASGGIVAKDSDKIMKDKVSLKIKHAVRKFKALKSTVEDLGSVEDMSENKVRESITESKEWKKELRACQENKDSIDLELISVDIEESVKTEFDTTYEEMSATVNDMITKLNKTDKDLGLFSLCDSKSKQVVQYPEAFTGLLGENIYKFIKEFKDAIMGDQVRKADEVRMLSKYLKGEAKACIGDHHKTLDTALEQLKENYGSPRLIVDKYLREFEKSLGHIKNWGKHGSKERVEAINRTLDFLRNLENLVNDHPDHLKSEVYSSSTLVLLTKGMPHEYSKQLNERCTHKDPFETWFTTAFDIMEESKSTNLSALSTGIGAAKVSNQDHGSTSSKSNYLKYNGHDCVKNPSCKDRWDLLGCVDLYKLSSVSERESFLRDRRACFKCGKVPFLIKNQRRHLCTWRNGKIDARCSGKSANGGRCWKGAAMCGDHDDNASDVLKNWLQSLKIKFTVNVIVANAETDDSYYERLKSELSMGLRSEKCSSKAVSRESLQSGEAAKMMDNSEILDFFTSDMRRMQSRSKVHGIPDGEAVFILTVVKGRSGPVMTFIDSGANCWLAREGIP